MKARIAVLFGGRSPEHWISFKSGLFVLLFLDRNLYEPSAVYLRPDGTFASHTEYLGVLETFFQKNKVKLFSDEDEVGDWLGLLREAADPRSSEFLSAARKSSWDLFFPVFHGRFGEDGTFQGLAETLGLPYAGCGFFGSALGMDKLLTKRICADRGLAIAPYREVHRDDWRRESSKLCADLISGLGLPVFVKPARLGSSIGVGRALTEIQLRNSLEEAFQYDHRVLVETEVRGIEYAVGVIGSGEDCETSVVAEFTMGPEQFNYDSKYGPQALDDIIPASLSPADALLMRDFAREVFVSLKMKGICRVDSFWGPEGPILNEVNTMPGVNPASPFVVAWEKTGLTKKALITKIVELALKG